MDETKPIPAGHVSVMNTAYLEMLRVVAETVLERMLIVNPTAPSVINLRRAIKAAEWAVERSREGM